MKRRTRMSRHSDSASSALAEAQNLDPAMTLSTCSYTSNDMITCPIEADKATDSSVRIVAEMVAAILMRPGDGN
jgi:hypothetical protein